MELFEFDDPGVYQAFKALAETCGIGELVERIEAGYSEATPGGIHWFYYCGEISGNTRLARRPKAPDDMKHQEDKVKVLIETKGEGGYAIIAPSNGNVHPTGKPYRLLKGGVKSIATGLDGVSSQMALRQPVGWYRCLP